MQPNMPVLLILRVRCWVAGNALALQKTLIVVFWVLSQSESISKALISGKEKRHSGLVVSIITSNRYGLASNSGTGIVHLWFCVLLRMW